MTKSIPNIADQARYARRKEFQQVDVQEVKTPEDGIHESDFPLPNSIGRRFSETVSGETAVMETTVSAKTGLQNGGGWIPEGSADTSHDLEDDRAIEDGPRYVMSSDNIESKGLLVVQVKVGDQTTVGQSSIRLQLLARKSKKKSSSLGWSTELEDFFLDFFGFLSGDTFYALPYHYSNKSRRYSSGSSLRYSRRCAER